MPSFAMEGRKLSARRAGALSPLICKVKQIALATSLILIISLSSSSFAQSADAQQITKAGDLFSAVLSIESADLLTALELLKSKKTLITPYLWHKLIAEAATAGSTSRSLFILDAAKYVAEQLGNESFLAYTYYRIGAVDISQGNTSRALQSYLLSKRLFEEANASTDLMCVLSELADLHVSMGGLPKG